MRTINKSQKWIGMAHVRPLADRDLLDGCPGAYVSVLALARDEAEFGNMVRSTLWAMGFSVLDLEDVELLEARMKSSTPESELLELAAVLGPQQRVGVGTFDAYQED